MFTTSRHIPTREESETVIDLALTSHPRTVEGIGIGPLADPSHSV
jgi:hypothetical protein